MDGLPAYLQISERLMREVADGHLRRGQKLAPERDLAAQFSVSVGTLRKALADLVDKGVLERRQGSGNYIKSEAAAGSAYSFFRLELLAGGGRPTARVLSFETCEKPTDAPFFGQGDAAYRIRRLRFLGAAPIALEEIWLDLRAGGPITTASSENSLYQVYKNELGLFINSVQDHVGLGQTPDWTTEPFGSAKGATTGYVERLSWAQDADPIEYSRTWFDTQKARYVSRMGK
ncbi:GntR family transcriptional regulator [Algirhabdus cladophorae]|uniref:GntR family transcriptional regulator n=1 Tax=Algirhabdus cladophorae TaxID=3377108 RepID=UPI003B847DF9